MSSGSFADGAAASTDATSLSDAARRRVAQAGRPWSSRQGVGEEVALRHLGFSPVGVVIGSVNSSGLSLAPRSSRKSAAPPPPGVQWQPTSLDDPVTARRYGGYVHDWRIGTNDRSARHIGWAWELVMHEQREHRLVDLVVSQLAEEAKALGAHGVVGVSLVTRRLGTEREYPILEVAASGTAVAAEGVALTSDPFTTALSGPAILKLAARGWAPVRIAVGIGHVRGVASRGSRRALMSVRNGEVRQLSELRQKSLEIAVQSLEDEARVPGELVVGVERTVTEEHNDVHTRLVGSTVCQLLPGPAPASFDFLRVIDLRQ